MSILRFQIETIPCYCRLVFFLCLFGYGIIQSSTPNMQKEHTIHNLKLFGFNIQSFFFLFQFFVFLLKIMIIIIMKFK